MSTPAANNSKEAVELRNAAAEFGSHLLDEPTDPIDRDGRRRNSRLLLAARRYAVVAYAEEQREKHPTYVQTLTTRIADLSKMVSDIQKSNARLYDERNAAVAGGTYGLKALWDMRLQRENDRLKSEIRVLKGRLAAVGQ